MNNSHINNYNINIKEDNRNAPLINNPELFQTDVLIHFFQTNYIIRKNVIYSISGKFGKKVSQNSSEYKKIYRCPRKKSWNWNKFKNKFYFWKLSIKSTNIYIYTFFISLM